MIQDAFLRIDSEEGKRYALVSEMFETVLCWKGESGLRFTLIIVKDWLNENDVLGYLMDNLLDTPTEIWSPSKACIEEAVARGWEYWKDPAGSPYVTNSRLLPKIKQKDNHCDKPGEKQLEIDDLFF